jgi:hypothetical protein
MLALKLKEWLNNGSYDYGVELLAQVSNNAFLLGVLRKGENPYNSIRLREEIEKISAMMPEPKAGAAEDFFLLPKEVQDVMLEAKKYFKMMMKQRDLLFSEDKEQRRMAALSILELSKLNKECWAKVEYWRKYKALPAEVKDTGIDELALDELIHLRDLDRNYVWKHEKKVKKLSGQKKTDMMERIAERRLRLATVELKLSQLTDEQRSTSN